MADQSTKLPAKRKRAQVSYVELGNDEYGDILETHTQDSDASDVNDDDINYGSRKVCVLRMGKSVDLILTAL